MTENPISTRADFTQQQGGASAWKWKWASRVLLAVGLLVFAGLTVWATLHADHPDSGPWLLRPDAPWTAAAALVMWVAALASWYRARRGASRPFAVVVVASSAAIALTMSVFSLAPCTRAGTDRSVMQDLVLTPLWKSLILFVGTSPDVYNESGTCSGGTPLAVQIARFLAMIAVFGTATALGVNLANRQLARMKARWNSYHDVVVGLGDDAMVVLRELVLREPQPESVGAAQLQEQTQPAGRRPERRKVLALYTEEQAAYEQQARALGVHTAPYDRERLGADGGIARRLTHYLTRRGKVAVDQVWVFDADPFTAIDIAEASFASLAAAHPRSTTRAPQIWAVLPERQLADSIRVGWLARDAAAPPTAPIRTPVCPAETTAMELIGRVAVEFRDTDYELVICGDSDLAESVLVELATRLWEESDLRAAWEKHCRSDNGECECAVLHDPEPQVAELPNHRDDLLVGGRMPSRALVVAPNAEALLWQVRHSLPGPLSRMLDTARAHNLDWRGLIPSTWPTSPDQPCAGIVADSIGPNDSYLGQRLLSLAQPGSVFWLPSALPGRMDPQAARERALPGHPIQEYAKNLFLAGHPPEDAWNRIARHQHERYRRVNYNPGKRDKRLPWWSPNGDHLNDRVREDNLASVRGVLAWFATHGFAWRRGNPPQLLPDSPLDSPPFGMSAEEWDDVLFSEYRRYTLAGDKTVAAELSLPAGDRKFTSDTVVTILKTLQANGYEPQRMGAPSGPAILVKLGAGTSDGKRNDAGLDS